MYIIEDEQFTLSEEWEANFAKDEFFAEMRVKSIKHLGRVRTALLESNGEVSFLFYPADQITPGLPIFPNPITRGPIRWVHLDITPVPTAEGLYLYQPPNPAGLQKERMGSDD